MVVKKKKTSTFGFELMLSKYCSGTEKHKVYTLSLYQASARLHSPTWFITTVNSICEHTHTHNPWHLFFYLRPSAAWMKIKLFEECFNHYPSVLKHTRSNKTELCPHQKTDNWHKLTLPPFLLPSLECSPTTCIIVASTVKNQEHIPLDKVDKFF